MRLTILRSVAVLSLFAVLVAACSAPNAAGTGGGVTPSAASTPTRSAGAQTTAASGAGPFALPSETRTDAGGSVTVEVTPVGADGDTLTFTVALNTHSVELSYDLAKIATLRDDQARTYAVRDWQGGSGGHHLEGNLTFEAPGDRPAKWLELELRDIGGVPSRQFRWELK